MVIEKRRLLVGGLSSRMTLAIAAALAASDLGNVTIVGDQSSRRGFKLLEDYGRTYRSALDPIKRELTPMQQEIIDAAAAKRRRKALKLTNTRAADGVGR